MKEIKIYETVSIYTDDDIALSVKYTAQKGGTVWKLLATSGDGTDVHTFTGPFAEVAAKTAFKNAIQAWMNEGVSIYQAAKRETQAARELGAMLE